MPVAWSKGVIPKKTNVTTGRHAEWRIATVITSQNSPLGVVFGMPDPFHYSSGATGCIHAIK
jgi:hypothetical protein